jgi:hypothetical protein
MLIARRRIQLSRTLGTRKTLILDALLALRAISREPRTVALEFLRRWEPFVVAVSRGAYAPNPALLPEPTPTRGGPLDWLYRSMRTYFCVGALWCERSGIPRRWLVQVRGRDRIRVLQQLRTMGGFRPVFMTHMPSFGLDRHLTREDFVHDHLEIARALRLCPRVRGIASYSWFYDPVIEEVSPRLRFLGEILDAGGCLRFELPTDEKVVTNALHASRSRREAHTAGRYHPRAFGRLWGRKQILRWSEAIETVSLVDRETARPVTSTSPAPETCR